MALEKDVEAVRRWLAFNRACGEDGRFVAQFLATGADPAALFGPQCDPQLQHRLPPRLRAGVARPDWRGVDADCRWLEQAGCHLLIFAEPGYPERLRQIPVPPPVLFVRGDPALLGGVFIAVVGSRRPTPPGREIAAEFAYGLGAAGVGIASGLAIGIDAAAHRAALEAGAPTAAVTGTGPEQVYPRNHRALAEEIAARGALVTEFAVGAAIGPRNFPRRNRIISGLSVGTLVVEAAQRSGSLSTAHHAMEQGREVFAVPGSIRNPLARGCHALIREGATLVREPADVLEAIGLRAVAPAAAQATAERDDDDAAAVLASLGYEDADIDTLVERSGLTVREVSSILLRLELQGRVTSNPGGRFVRIASKRF
ncbi:MAG: DNA-processing protein DprA [Gammaproteobacteria bacterium]